MTIVKSNHWPTTWNNTLHNCSTQCHSGKLNKAINKELSSTYDAHSQCLQNQSQDVSPIWKLLRLQKLGYTIHSRYLQRRERHILYIHETKNSKTCNEYLSITLSVRKVFWNSIYIWHSHTYKLSNYDRQPDLRNYFWTVFGVVGQNRLYCDPANTHMCCPTLPNLLRHMYWFNCLKGFWDEKLI